MRYHSLVSPHQLRLFCVLTGLLSAGAVLLWRPLAAANGISRGLSVCADVLIPSLFPFLVLGGFLVRSGAAAAIGRRLERPTRLLFGLPGCCAAGILIAFVGGYPAGASVIAQLRREGRITAEEGQRMLRFCVAGGPGFVVNAVGIRLLSNGTLGGILFAAHVAAALLMGLCGAPLEARKPTASRPVPSPRCSTAAALVESVTAACETMLSMCGFVILFSALLTLSASFLPPNAGKATSVLLAGLLEVSSGCVAAAPLGAVAPGLLSFFLGFGGLSVHCQIRAALQGTDTITSDFLVSRLLHGILVALFTAILLKQIINPKKFLTANIQDPLW